MNENVKIPKKIHFIWYGGKVPQHIEQYINQVREMYPKYKIKVWGKKDFDPNTIPYTRKALKEKKYAFVSDYLRAKILYEEGGIYLDTDMIPIKSVEPFLINKVVIGFEYIKMLGTGFCAAEPGHPFFKKIIETYELQKEESEVKFVVNNELWTFVMKDVYGLKLNNTTQLLQGDVKVYPSDRFAEMKITDYSVFLHDHKLTWVSSKLKKNLMKPALDRIQRNGEKISWLLSIAAIQQFRKNKKAIKKLNESKSREIKK